VPREAGYAKREPRALPDLSPEDGRDQACVFCEDNSYVVRTNRC